LLSPSTGLSSPWDNRPIVLYSRSACYLADKPLVCFSLGWLLFGLPLDSDCATEDILAHNGIDVKEIIEQNTNILTCLLCGVYIAQVACVYAHTALSQNTVRRTLRMQTPDANEDRMRPVRHDKPSQRTDASPCSLTRECVTIVPRRGIRFLDDYEVFGQHHRTLMTGGHAQKTNAATGI
jgi:hypothetical protein